MLQNGYRVADRSLSSVCVGELSHRMPMSVTQTLVGCQNSLLWLTNGEYLNKLRIKPQ